MVGGWGEKQLLEGDKISKYCSVDQNTSSFNVFFAEIEGVENDEKGMECLNRLYT